MDLYLGSPGRGRRELLHSPGWRDGPPTEDLELLHGLYEIMPETPSEHSGNPAEGICWFPFPFQLWLPAVARVAKH